MTASTLVEYPLAWPAATSRPEGAPDALPTSAKTFDAVFRVEKDIGRGRFGEVQLVTEKGGRGGRYAVKRTAFGSDGQPDRQKVEVEARALERLRHPNVIAHHGAWQEEKHFCILMEYAEHGDFASLLASRWAEAEAEGRKFLDEAEVMRYFVMLADGLAHVHSKRVVHRDLKPENVFVCGGGVLKIGDFGISRVLSLSVTELAQTVVGSPTYISPELIQGKPYSYKTDIWSLGVMLYRVASNKFPFNANNLAQLALKITEGAFPSLSKKYSPALHHLVASMLQIEPEARADTDELTHMDIVGEHRARRRAEEAAAAEVAAEVGPTGPGRRRSEARPRARIGRARPPRRRPTPTTTRCAGRPGAGSR